MYTMFTNVSLLLSYWEKLLADLREIMAYTLEVAISKIDIMSDSLSESSIIGMSVIYWSQFGRKTLFHS